VDLEVEPSHVVDRDIHSAAVHAQAHGAVLVHENDAAQHLAGRDRVHTDRVAAVDG
jgi:hypothetical protein